MGGRSIRAGLGILALALALAIALVLSFRKIVVHRSWWVGWRVGLQAPAGTGRFLMQPSERVGL
jgi:hypothetical protein